jgi:DNA-binding response OmpR family regulator
LGKRRILIVDDEVLATRNLKIFLEEAGHYWVRTENEGKRTFPAVEEFNPELILLDIMLPDLDGSEISSQLRQDPRFSEIPVVFLTGMLTEDEVGAQGSLVGGRPFLAKPVRPQQVLECIRTVLKGDSVA